jgi:glutamine synthetase
MAQSPQDVLQMIQEQNIKMIDLKFIDTPGIWQHCSFYYNQIDESSFVDGVPFDGSK